MKWERDEVDEGMQMESDPSINTDTSTQTMSTCTVDGTMQTVPNDEMPRLLNDTGTSTKLPSTYETSIQANETPTSPSTPAISAMSSLTMPAQPPSMMLTTATTTTSPASEPPPACQKWWQWLPGRTPSPQLTSQPLLSYPQTPITTATSQLPMPALPTATASEMAYRVSSSTQMATTTTGTHHHTVNDIQRLSTAQQTELCQYKGMHSLEHIVHMTE
jgi:hypothetical protein